MTRWIPAVVASAGACLLVAGVAVLAGVGGVLVVVGVGLLVYGLRMEV